MLMSSLLKLCFAFRRGKCVTSVMLSIFVTSLTLLLLKRALLTVYSLREGHSGVELADSISALLQCSREIPVHDYRLYETHRPPSLNGRHGNVLAPSDCKRRYDLIVYVHSTLCNFRNRQQIRETWGDATAYPDMPVRIVFVVGSPPTKDETFAEVAHQVLAFEHRTFGDILMASFEDHYMNSTLKGIVALKWLTESCFNAPFVLKTDDDDFVNMPNLLGKLPFLEAHSASMMCRIVEESPVPRSGPGVVYFKEFTQTTYPKMCNGSVYLMSWKAVESLVDASYYRTIFKQEAVYFTGLLAEAAALQHRDISPLYADSVDAAFECPAHLDYFFVKIDKDWQTSLKWSLLWKTILNPQAQCQRTSQV